MIALIGFFLSLFAQPAETVACHFVSGQLIPVRLICSDGQERSTDGSAVLVRNWCQDVTIVHPDYRPEAIKMSTVESKYLLVPLSLVPGNHH